MREYIELAAERKLKILMATSEFSPYRGGIGTYCAELAAAAVADGHHVTVLAPDYGEDRSGEDAALPYAVARFKGGAPTARGVFRRCLSVLECLKRERFDVVHAIDWPFFAPIALARTFWRKPRFVNTVHGTEVFALEKPRRKVLLSATRFWSYSWEWLANSEYTRRALLENAPQVRDGSTVATPLAVSESWFEGREPRLKARQTHGLSDTDFVILSLGRVVPRKGHGVLAEALSKVSPEISHNLRWWIIGPEIEPDYAAQLRTATSNLSCEVEFLGKLPLAEVQSRLSASDLFCLPGFQEEAGVVEGFGLAFLEAAAYGVPSVATWSGGIPEAVEHNYSGLLVPERSSEAVAEAIVALVQDRSFLARLAEGAEAKARARSWHDVSRESYAQR